MFLIIAGMIISVAAEFGIFALIIKFVCIKAKIGGYSYLIHKLLGSEKQ